jgi:hypothetical protein
MQRHTPGGEADVVEGTEEPENWEKSKTASESGQREYTRTQKGSTSAVKWTESGRWTQSWEMEDTGRRLDMEQGQEWRHREGPGNGSSSAPGWERFPPTRLLGQSSRGTPTNRQQSHCSQIRCGCWRCSTPETKMGSTEGDKEGAHREHRRHASRSRAEVKAIGGTTRAERIKTRIRRGGQEG